MTFRKLLLLAALLFFLAPVTAQSGKSLVLDGCTNYFEVPDDDRLDYQNGLTIEAWIKPNCDEGNLIIVAKEWCRQEYAYYLSVNDQRLLYSFSTDGNCNFTSEIGTTDQLITPGEFHHVAVVNEPQESSSYLYLMRFNLNGQVREESGSFSLIR